jgi:hypothetical protein
MTNVENELDGLSSTRINPSLAELDQLIRKSLSVEKLAEELLEQRAWFLDRLGKNSRRLGTAEPATVHAKTRPLYATNAASLPHCAWNFNKLTLDTLSAFVARNNGELQFHLWNEPGKTSGVCLRFSRVAEVEMVLALLMAAMEFQSARKTDDGLEKNRQTEAFSILKRAGGSITIASLVQTATYLGFRIRIAIGRN